MVSLRKASKLFQKKNLFEGIGQINASIMKALYACIVTKSEISGHIERLNGVYLSN